jgi:hypothetical protein
MKKLLLVFLIFFGLKTHAQLNWCDSLDLGISIMTNPIVDPELKTCFFTPQISPSLYPYITQWLWVISDARVDSFSCAATYDIENPVHTLNPGINSDSLLADTVYICLYVAADTSWGCNFCDTFVFNNQGLPYPTWIPLSESNQLILSINEFNKTSIKDNKIYDLMGRKLNKIPIGTPYIKNGKKYIKIEQ